MLKVNNIQVFNFDRALFSARNPLNSWDKSSPEADLDLARRLYKAGPEHRKYLRQIMICCDILAPLYWWSQFDTYKVGTTANSTSKMHTLMKKPFEMSDFSFEKLNGYKNVVKQFRPLPNVEIEQWKPITNCDGYFVSSEGRIKHGDRILSGSIHDDFYIFTNIKNKQIAIHRLVADAFLPKIDGKDIVNHKDGNKMNNCVDNLEWCTQSENAKHAHINNLQPKGLSTYKGKFSNEEREQIKKEWDNGTLSKRELAKKYNVSHTCICDIINDKYKYIDTVNIFEECARPYIDVLNNLRDMYLNECDQEKKKTIWYSIIQMLPESFNQLRTVTMNYENLVNIIHQRSHHKLDEWHQFIDALRTGTNINEIIDND